MNVTICRRKFNAHARSPAADRCWVFLGKQEGKQFFVWEEKEGRGIPLRASCTQPIQIDTDDQLVFARHYFLNQR